MTQRESTLDFAETITWWVVTALALIAAVLLGLLVTAIVKGGGIERLPAPYVATAPAAEQPLAPPLPVAPAPAPPAPAQPAPAPVGPPR